MGELGLNADLTSKPVPFPLNYEDRGKRYGRTLTGVDGLFKLPAQHFPGTCSLSTLNLGAVSFAELYSMAPMGKCHLTSLSVKQTLRITIWPNPCYCSLIYPTTVLLINRKACSRNVRAGLSKLRRPVNHSSKSNKADLCLNTQIFNL